MPSVFLLVPDACSFSPEQPILPSELHSTVLLSTYCVLYSVAIYGNTKPFTIALTPEMLFSTLYSTLLILPILLYMPTYLHTVNAQESPTAFASIHKPWKTWYRKDHRTLCMLSCSLIDGRRSNAWYPCHEIL